MTRYKECHYLCIQVTEVMIPIRTAIAKFRSQGMMIPIKTCNLESWFKGVMITIETSILECMLGYNVLS